MCVITLADRTIHNPIFKDKATFLETAAETNGKFTLIQVELAPNGGNDLHYHKTFEETFTVLEGTLGIQVDNEIIYLKKGETATAPRASSHRFFNPSDTETVIFNVLLEPGRTGFETSLQVAYGLASDGLTTSRGIPKSPYHMALLVEWSDTNMPGIFRLLEPVLKWFAQLAIQKGIDRALIQRYCRF